MSDATDCQLLHRFACHRDEAAFATLARRHAARVLGVCRRVLRNEHDAEEVVQAAFLVLARKAGLLPWSRSIGPWLSAVARRLALNARSRRERERPAPLLLADESAPESCVRDADPADGVAEGELRELVREELSRLPEKYRAPVVLCYLEGKTNEQAARELGWPAGSMSRRLEKARRLLRERLVDRGLVALSALLCVLLAAWVVRVGPTVEPASPVATAMSRFQPGTEEHLRRFAEGGSPLTSREQLLTIAEDASRVADCVEGHDPGHRLGDWKRYTRAMRTAAQQLTLAARADDRSGTLVAAARLHASCSHCHTTFRD
jgi:RNA polymerase sigma factor (sigma-70 family)